MVLSERKDDGKEETDQGTCGVISSEIEIHFNTTLTSCFLPLPFLYFLHLLQNGFASRFICPWWPDPVLSSAEISKMQLAVHYISLYLDCGWFYARAVFFRILSRLSIGALGTCQVLCSIPGHTCYRIPPSYSCGHSTWNPSISLYCMEEIYWVAPKEPMIDLALKSWRATSSPKTKDNN